MYKLPTFQFAEGGFWKEMITKWAVFIKRFLYNLIKGIFMHYKYIERLTYKVWMPSQEIHEYIHFLYSFNRTTMLPVQCFNLRTVKIDQVEIYPYIKGGLIEISNE